MNRYKPRALVETSFMVALVVLFTLIVYVVPGIGVLLNFLLPVPFALVGKRHGLRWNLLGWVAALVLTSLFAGPVIALVEIGSFGTMGVVLGMAYRNEWGSIRRLFLPAAVFFAAFIAQFYVTQLLLHVDLLAQFEKAYLQGIEASIELYRNAGLTEERLKEVHESMMVMWKQMRIIIPGALITSSVLVSYIDNLVANVILNRLGIKTPSFPPLMRWEMPRATLYLFVVAWIASYWGTQWQNDWLLWIGLNLNIIVMPILWIQGLAFFKYVVETRNMSKAIFIIGFIMSLLLPVATYVVVGAGMMDLILRFRYKRNYM